MVLGWGGPGAVVEATRVVLDGALETDRGSCERFERFERIEALDRQESLGRIRWG